MKSKEHERLTMDTHSRQDLHQLIDRLPDSELLAVRQFLEERVLEDDPLARALDNAPYDDEPWTEANEQAFRESEADIAAGRVYTTDEIRRYLEEPGS